MKVADNLVALLELDQDFMIDLKYATKDNFTNEIVYPTSTCFIDKNTAKLLINAKNRFKKDGFRVKVWDAFRPISAQFKFWVLVPDDNFVAKPPNMKTLTKFRNSHMNGQCVDITLTDLDGQDILMPSEFDDFSIRARLDNPEIDSKAKENALYMKNIMEECGFAAYNGEWWHFYDHQTKPCKYSDIEL